MKMPRNEKAEGTPPEQEMADNDETAYKEIVNCTNTLEVRNIGSYLYKSKCKWGNRIKELQLDGE
jgi:hypothetical protein